ncbi:MAG TPA: hypothetical protein VGW40_11295 [Allosphingosinicella sp.]|nr:hypothetical protein [Allosphingosinicella sp.]
MRPRSIAAGALLLLAQPIESQPVPAPPARLTYADLADLSLAAPVVVHLRVRDADALDPRDAPNVSPGRRRFLVEADVVALIRGAGGLPARVSYLVDVANDSRGRPARFRRGDELIVLAGRVPDRPAELRLAAPDAQLPYAPETAERLRAILREASAPDAAPRLTGIGRAFHVEGSLPGEGETQIFLQAAGERPISLNILRRPGEQPRWSVALSEIVDAAATPPVRDTLLWYRLACALPPRLPPQSLSEAAPGEARAIQADYRLVLDGLGPCARTRARR